MDFRQKINFLKFAKDQRTGIVLLFGIIIVLQLVYYFMDFNPIPEKDSGKQQWLSLHTKVDSL